MRRRLTVFKKLLSALARLSEEAPSPTLPVKAAWADAGGAAPATEKTVPVPLLREAAAAAIGARKPTTEPPTGSAPPTSPRDTATDEELSPRRRPAPMEKPSSDVLSAAGTMAPAPAGAGAPDGKVAYAVPVALTASAAADVAEASKDSEAPRMLAPPPRLLRPRLLRLLRPPSPLSPGVAGGIAVD
jgi:hypothetical protein